MVKKEVRVIPEILEKCVSKLQAQGKSKSSAFAICTASSKKAGKLEQLLEKLEEAEVGNANLESYLQENALSDDMPKSPTFRRFSSQVLNFPIESLSLDDKNTTTIQCLRMGKFKHPWYGILKFDQPFFESMIKNFDADIPNPEIAFDFKHQPDFGAAAWISKIFVEEKNLMADVTLTERGKKSIQSGEFKYFSVEYTDDYAEYEFNEKVDENGKAIEEETRLSHGPTVLGGGLTNRPFIKGMAPVSLGEDGKMITLEEVKDDDFSQSTKEVKESMKTLEELKAEQDQINSRMKELEEKKDDKASKEELEGLVTKLEEISTAVKELSDEGNEDAAKTLEELDKAKLDLEEANKKLEEKDGKVVELSESVEALSKTVTKLMESNQVLQEKDNRSSVEKRLMDFQKLGVFPATLKVVENIAFSESARDFSVTLSEGEGDEKKDVQKSFLDVVESILASIPEDHRFTDSESSESVITPTGTPKEASIEDVQKYADEKKITFEEALVDFSKEGKIAD